MKVLLMVVVLGLSLVIIGVLVKDKDKDKGKSFLLGLEKKLDNGGDLLLGWQKKFCKGDIFDCDIYCCGKIINLCDCDGLIFIEVDNIVVCLVEDICEIVLILSCQFCYKVV